MPSNNFNILPFYESTDEWSRNDDKAFGEKYCIATPDRRIPPFQIYAEGAYAEDAPFLQAHLVRIETGDSTDITASLSETGLKVIDVDDQGNNSIILYRGRLPINQVTPQGEYYLRIFWPDALPNSEDLELYSEPFTVVRNVSDKLRITYSSNTDIEYKSGAKKLDFTSDPAFKFECYLDTALNTPDYPFEEEGEDRDGFFFTEKQISEKTYKFNFLAPEFMCDAMRIVRMMDEVEIEYKGKTYDVERFLPTPEWQQGGFWAAIAVEFQCDTVVKRIGAAYAAPSGADYSADYGGEGEDSDYNT